MENTPKNIRWLVESVKSTYINPDTRKGRRHRWVVHLPLGMIAEAGRMTGSFPHLHPRAIASPFYSSVSAFIVKISKYCHPQRLPGDQCTILVDLASQRASLTHYKNIDGLMVLCRACLLWLLMHPH